MNISTLYCCALLLLLFINRNILHQKWDSPTCLRYLAFLCCVKCLVTRGKMESHNEEMKRFFTMMIEKIQDRPTANAVSVPELISVPYFHPERNELESWIGEIEKLMLDFGWGSRETVSRIGPYLIGESKSWFERWQPDERVWSALKTDLTRAFPRKHHLGRWLQDAVLFNSERSRTYEQYAREKYDKLRRCKVNFTEEQYVELIIHGIVDTNVSTTVLNSKCEHVSDLISILARFEKFSTTKCSSSLRNNHKRRYIEQSNIPSHSRAEFSDSRRCYECNELGHVRLNCPKRNFEPRKSGIAREFKHSKLQCTFCSSFGHTEDRCWAKARVTNENKKQVNFCNTDRQLQTTIAVVNGCIVDCLIDTGAACSLISEKLAAQLNARFEPRIQALRGIGDRVIFSKFVTNLLVEFEEVTVEISFFIVPVNVMQHDVLIGQDLFAYPHVQLVQDLLGSRIIARNLKHREILYFNVDDILTNCCNDQQDPEIKRALLTLLNEYRDIITRGNAVSLVNNGELKIRLKEESIINYHPYRLSVSERNKVREIVADLTDSGIIRESQSPYASPILLVKKKNGSERMCVDFRALNRLTIKDRFPLPRIDDQLDRLGKGVYFTSLDMASGFHQIPIHPDSIEYTAFVTPDGHFEYLRMPFGLANAPAVFQRLINKALGSLATDVALVYLDDILIPSTTVTEGLDSLKQVLTALRAAGFSLNIDKCKFLQTDIEYLGREISAEGVKPGFKKVQALVNSPVPTNVREVRQFMGLAGYFRRFVRDFAAKTAVITKLTKNGEPWVWASEHEQARQYVINVLTQRPVLAVFNPTLPTELHTDASSIGYGAILLQTVNGVSKVIAYFSKRTTPEESRYHSYELETLAIFNALKHFRVYLLGISFKIITDCNAVKATQNKKDLIPRVARWWLYFQDFNFEIEYRKGKEIGHVDYLSRNPITVHKLTTDHWLYIAQRQDPETQTLYDSVSTNSQNKDYQIINKMLYHTSHVNNTVDYRMYVPVCARIRLLIIFHDEQFHIGMEKTYDTLRQYFWFPNMRHFVDEYVRKCITCTTRKRFAEKPQGLLYPIDKHPVPFHTIHMDCLGPFVTKSSSGHSAILILVDAFTKYCLLYPLLRLTADEIKEHTFNFISLFGTPTRIIADAGSCFTGIPARELFATWCIEFHATTPQTHRSNGQVERYMRTVANMLRVDIKNKSEWASRLPTIQLTLNTTVHKITKCTPLEMLIGNKAVSPIIRAILDDRIYDPQPAKINTLQTRTDFRKVKERIDKNAEKQKEYFDKRRRDTLVLKVGDFVVIAAKGRTAKLDPGHYGPFEITDDLGRDRYQLLDLTTKTKTVRAKEHLRLWPSQWSADDCQYFMDTVLDDQQEQGMSPC